ERFAGDALLDLGQLKRAEATYRRALARVQSPPEFAASPTAEIRRAQIAAGLGRLEWKRAQMNLAGSVEATRPRRSACAQYQQADAIFRKRLAGTMFIEDRMLMADVEKALEGCVAGNDADVKILR